jgi:hypothetical protein
MCAPVKRICTPGPDIGVLSRRNMQSRARMRFETGFGLAASLGGRVHAESAGYLVTVDEFERIGFGLGFNRYEYILKPSHDLLTVLVEESMSVVRLLEPCQLSLRRMERAEICDARPL